MIPKEKVESLITKHKSIEIELSSGDLDSKKFENKSKEYSELNEIIPFARKFLNYDAEKKDLENIINDTKTDREILSEAKKELLELNKKKNSI
tara:strand:+ start:2111 stop:2389 length:279 start_codon:yes stop_codon:yes gene_type:complete